MAYQAWMTSQDISWFVLELTGQSANIWCDLMDRHHPELEKCQECLPPQIKQHTQSR